MRRCRITSCCWCNRSLASDLRGAIKLAAPTHFMLITGLTEDLRDNRRAVNRLIEYLRRSRFSLQLCWAIEPNPAEDGFHAHAWVRCDHIAPEQLQKSAYSAGLGLTRMRPVDARESFDYIVKLSTHNATSARRFHQLNGGHLVHATRGFWLDVAGQPVARHEALRAARATYEHSAPESALHRPLRHTRALSPRQAARNRELAVRKEGPLSAINVEARQRLIPHDRTSTTIDP